MWNNSLRESWNIAPIASQRFGRNVKWNLPTFAKRIFHICGANISQRSYFTCPQGQISLKKAHIVLVDKCVLFSGGENGIRTHETGYGLHDFQSCALDQLGHLSTRLLYYSRYKRESQDFFKNNYIFYNIKILKVTFIWYYFEDFHYIMFLKPKKFKSHSRYQAW